MSESADALRFNRRLPWSAALLVLGLTMLSGPAAADPVIRVAVASTEAEGLGEALRTEVERAPDLVLVDRSVAADLELRGRVVRMEHSDGATHEVRCEVSVVVAEAGSIRATLRGRGGAAAQERHARLEGDAMRTAVRGALRPLGSVAGSLVRARRHSR